MRNDEYVYEKQHVGKYLVKVVQDEDPPQPREWCDHIDHMICFHRRYTIGDKHSEDKDSLLEIIQRKDVLSLPIYMYDHSGITINTTGFSCQWDSGQIGFIYMTKEEILNNWGGKKLTKKLKEKAYDSMRASVKDFDDYLTGAVYGYCVEDETGNTVDSCWGFYGETKDCLQEGVSVAEWHVKDDMKKHVNKVKQWIRHRVPLEKRMVMV